jgi:hypothetical protein
MIYRHRVISILQVALLCVSLLGSAVVATTIIRMDLKTLAQSAQLISRARCVSTESRWERGSIWTFDEFDVLEIFKGEPPQRLRIRLPGGRIGHEETKIEGVPRFSQGEEVVLFAEQTSAGDYGVTSWAQGTFRVHRDAAGSDATLTQDTTHFAVLDPATRKLVSGGARDLPLTEFRRQIVEALGATSLSGRHQ